MRKIVGLVLSLVTFAVMCTGCRSEEVLNENKVITDKTVKANWFENDKIDSSYMLDKVSFSKNNECAVLSYTTMKMGAKLDEYYTFYYANLKGDQYTQSKEMKFDKDYYPINAHITYSGDKVVFSGIPAEQAKTVEGFNNGCNLYIGDFKDGKVSNVKQLDFKEEGMRYYIVSTLEDESILYNTYDAKNDKFTSKIAINNNGEYEVKEIDLGELNGYYTKLAYVLEDKAFIWIADITDKSFKAYITKYSDGNFSEMSSISPEFMNSKDYSKFYSAVGADRDGGIYIHEAASNGVALYRCKVENFSK